MLAGLATSMLYKKANWRWPFLIRRRHLRFRRRLAARGPGPDQRAEAVVAAGV